MRTLLAALLAAPALAMALTNGETTGEQRRDVLTNAPIPAGAVVIIRHQLGSGAPGFVGKEHATHMGDGIYHAPQFLPSYPTAGAIWPRIIEVECEVGDKANTVVCDGYNWMPAYGRGEYLMIRPTMKKPVDVRRDLVVIPGPERVVIKEVPPKPKRE